MNIRPEIHYEWQYAKPYSDERSLLEGQEGSWEETKFATKGYYGCGLQLNHFDQVQGLKVVFCSLLDWRVQITERVFPATDLDGMAVGWKPVVLCPGGFYINGM